MFSADPVARQVGGELGKVTGLVARAEVSLHELSSSTDIEKAWRCMAALRWKHGIYMDLYIYIYGFI